LMALDVNKKNYYCFSYHVMILYTEVPP
jgi:hypothetical protein